MILSLDYLIKLKQNYNLHSMFINSKSLKYSSHKTIYYNILLGIDYKYYRIL